MGAPPTPRMPFSRNCHFGCGLDEPIYKCLASNESKLSNMSTRISVRQAVQDRIFSVNFFWKNNPIFNESLGR